MSGIPRTIGEIYASMERYPRAAIGAEYYSVIIPWAPAPIATEWHPTEQTGPFSTLARGAFATYAIAVQWARDHLGGAPYSVQCVPTLQGGGEDVSDA